MKLLISHVFESPISHVHLSAITKTSKRLENNQKKISTNSINNHFLKTVIFAWYFSHTWNEQKKSEVNICVEFFVLFVVWLQKNQVMKRQGNEKKSNWFAGVSSFIWQSLLNCLNRICYSPDEEEALLSCVESPMWQTPINNQKWQGNKENGKE